MRNVVPFHYEFRGAFAPPAVANRIDRFCSKITSASTNATLKAVSGGTMDLAMTADSEVQNVCLYQGDILPFAIGDLLNLEIVAKVSASLAAAVTVSFGIATARNDTPASISTYALFQCVGNNNVVISASDGTHTKSAIATGLTLGTTLKRFKIDLCTGVQSVALPGVSKGGRAATKFWGENTIGNLATVCDLTLFDLSAYAATSGVQLFAQIQKTSGTAVGTLSIESFSGNYREH